MVVALGVLMFLDGKGHESSGDPQAIGKPQKAASVTDQNRISTRNSKRQRPSEAIAASAGQVADARSAHTALTPQPPFQLVPGKPIPGRLLVLPQLKVDGGNSRMEYGFIRRRLLPEGLRLDISNISQETGGAFGCDEWYRRASWCCDHCWFSGGGYPKSVRSRGGPKNGNLLQLDVEITEDAFSGTGISGIFFWKEQPYEILNAALQVVYSYPESEELGVRRAPLPFAR